MNVEFYVYKKIKYHNEGITFLIQHVTVGEVLSYFKYHNAPGILMQHYLSLGVLRQIINIFLFLTNLSNDLVIGQQ